MEREQVDEVLSLNSSLDKAITNNSLEEITDILKILADVKMTAECLKITKIGVTVSKLKKTNETAKNLVKEWMRIYEESKASKESKKEVTTIQKQSPSEVHVDSLPPATLNHSSDGAKEATTSVESTTPADEDDEDMRRYLSSLPEGRRKVLEHLRDLFRQDTSSTSGSTSGSTPGSTSGSIAFALASGIEGSVDAVFPFHKDAKAYGAKARTLAFNIKKNEELRVGLVDGVIPPQALVHMSANDLATEEQRRQRQQATKADIDARRSDYYQVNRANILKSIGVDPTKGGEFTCRRCGQNKTTHYSLQTRSADEPMTVFVTCLTCSNRWKTN